MSSSKPNFQKVFFILFLFTIISAATIGYFVGKNSHASGGESSTNTPTTILPQKNRQPANPQASEVYQKSKDTLVIAYIRKYGTLPDYYITKKEAQANGWIPSAQNLCEALPGKIIGGDVFENRERKLPQQKGRIWYEADINYSCEKRGVQRVVYANDGLIFVTYNHYKTFERK